MGERRGFTLVETMIVCVIALLVGGAIHNLLVSTQRLTRDQSQQVSLQSNIRAGSLVVTNELRELSTMPGGTAEQNDILRIGPSAITYRAMRGLGFICQPPTAGAIRIGRNRFSGHRDPQPGRDTAYVFMAGTPDGTVADSWLPLPISSVSTGNTCPGGQGPGISLGIANTVLLTPLEVGSPVRIVEVMELRLYQSDGKSWLGARSVSAGEVSQPLVGPLDEGRGFALEYLNAWGSPTTDLTGIKSIRVALRGSIEDSGRDHLEEELITQVTLRNALRQ